MIKNDFEWTGDLEDDCSCVWRRMIARTWYADFRWVCTVFRVDARVRKTNHKGRPRRPIFDSEAFGIHPIHSEAARQLCELVMRDYNYTRCRIVAASRAAKARNKLRTPERRSEIASNAGKARWVKWRQQQEAE